MEKEVNIVFFESFLGGAEPPRMVVVGSAPSVSKNDQTTIKNYLKNDKKYKKTIKNYTKWFKHCQKTIKQMIFGRAERAQKRT